MQKETIARSDWIWIAGISYFSVRFIPVRSEDSTDGTLPIGGELIWKEEVSPEDDDRGNGYQNDSTQPLAEFLGKGPHYRAPVAVAEALLTYFSADEPAWFAPYRLIVAVTE